MFDACSYMVISDMSRSSVTATMPHDWKAEAMARTLTDMPAYSPSRHAESFSAALMNAEEARPGRHRRDRYSDFRRVLRTVRRGMADIAAAIVVTSAVLVGVFRY